MESLTPDCINGAFELLGSLFTWMNVRRVVRDRGYAGIYLPVTVFFFSWGFWNLFYYSHLDQWWSLAGGSSLVLANLSWVSVMLWFGSLANKKPRPSA